jgi:hypothetical protein
LLSYICRPLEILSLTALFILLIFLLRLQDWSRAHFGVSNWKCLTPVVLQALVCMSAEYLYRRCAEAEWRKENQNDLNDKLLITRLALFQSISGFCPLFYIAFWLRDWKRLQEVKFKKIVIKFVQI